MCDFGGDGFEVEGLDPDALLWVRGVDYLTGWRDAARVAGELGDVLTAVGVDLEGVKLRAGTTANGSGVVRLELPAATAREIAKLAQTAAAQCRRAG
ncbi:hypothetical protein ACFVFQ_36155 [Streptomyces sp. NPDC057743]|uniref:hypothetical protein n=1 Tax=Streptomyces sp. NPDC057743 TaxID=3346236 RepID=UPI0036B370DC